MRIVECIEVPGSTYGVQGRVGQALFGGYVEAGLQQVAVYERAAETRHVRTHRVSAAGVSVRAHKVTSFQIGKSLGEWRWSGRQFRKTDPLSRRTTGITLLYLKAD
jgi:hypothetical protein